MEPLSLDYVAEACQGERRGGRGDALVRRVCTDSRQVTAEDLFVAISGARHDGHQFLGVAAARGAGALMAQRGQVQGGESAPLILVDDTRTALGRLAASYRNQFSELNVIAVGGSNGKTTTKEMLGAVLSKKYPALWSRESFNNDIGVPATLLDLEKRHHAAVVEVGSNHPGELAPLLRMARPRYGVVTSLGREHLEFFGDLAGVAEEEGSMAESIPADGVLFVNGDSPEMDRITRRAACRVVSAGFGAGHDWRCRVTDITLRGVTFEVVAGAAGYKSFYQVRFVGRHQVVNALLTIAVAAELGVSLEEIRLGLAECRPPKGRLQLWSAGGVHILDDSYNANADSMNAALETLAELPGAGRRVAVLGEMAELGLHAGAAHDEVGRKAAELGVDRLFAVGAGAARVAEGALAAGMAEAHTFSGVDETSAALAAWLRPGDMVLLKASRSARLERVGDRLRDCHFHE